MRQATRTEYKGVTYRSKTEAIFARCLDLAGFNQEYEPDCLRLGLSYQPDFLAGKNTFPHARNAIIEVKPSMPTRSYLDNLFHKMYKQKPYPIEETFKYIYGGKFDFSLAIFNPFDRQFDVICPTADGLKWNSHKEFVGWCPGRFKAAVNGEMRWHDNYADHILAAMHLHSAEAMKYRFDLNQG